MLALRISEIRQVDFLLPVRLQQHAIDHVDVDRRASGRADRFEHRGQAQIATATQHAVGRADDQLGRSGGERVVRQPDAIQLALDELTHRVIVQTPGDDRVGHAAFDVLVDRQIQVRQQFDLADQNQVVVLGKIFQQQPQLAKVFHLHQMGVVDDGDQHLAAAIETEGLLDQFAFAFERGAFELDLERFAEDLHRVGVGVQCASDRGDQVFFLRQPLERFFDDRLAGAGPVRRPDTGRLVGSEREACRGFLADGVGVGCRAGRTGLG